MLSMAEQLGLHGIEAACLEFDKFCRSTFQINGCLLHQQPNKIAQVAASL